MSDILGEKAYLDRIVREEFKPGVVPINAAPSNVGEEIESLRTELADIAKRKMISAPYAFEPCTPIHSSGNAYYMRGVDYQNNILFANDTVTGGFVVSTDYGQTWVSKVLPNNVDANVMMRVIYFKGYVYVCIKDNADGLMKVYRSLPYVGGGNYSWSSPLISLKQYTTNMAGCFDCDDNYMYLAEYGSNAAFDTPSIYRSSDGATWKKIIDSDPSIKHFHGVKPDPFNPGHVWVTGGDNGVKSVMKSTDYGTSWSVVVAGTYAQGVQISFDKNYVYISGDQKTATVIVIDKATGKFFNGSKNHHKNIAVPTGTAGDKFYSNAFFGCVDANTGIYYCCANDVLEGNKPGLFYLPQVGERIEILDYTVTTYGYVFILGQYLYFGTVKHRLLTIE